jgi:hypothetical protein
LPVAPIGEETLTPCTFLNFTDFFLYSCNTITWCKMVSSTNILVHYIEPHLAYSIECRLFNQLEKAEKKTYIFQDGGQIKRQKRTSITTIFR